MGILDDYLSEYEQGSGEEPVVGAPPFSGILSSAIQELEADPTLSDDSLPYDGGYEDGSIGYADMESGAQNAGENKTTLSDVWDSTKDLGVAGVKSTIQATDWAVGLADASTAAPAEALVASADDEALYNLLSKSEGGRLGMMLEEVGYKPSEALKILDSWYSDKYQGQKKAFADAEGFSEKMGVIAKNPALVGNSVVESLGPMLAGQTVGRFLMFGSAGAAGGTLGKVLGLSDDLLQQAPRLASWLAGAAGEGVTAAGSNLSQMRGESKTGTISSGQYGAGLLTGITTGAIGAFSNKLQGRLGIENPDTFLLENLGSKLKLPWQKVVAAAGLSGLTESVLEEMPQSAVEQSILNLAQGKPWYEGVEDATIMGGVTGFAMGAGVQGRKLFVPQSKSDADQILAEAGIDPDTGELNQKGKTEGVGATAEQINKMLGINDMTPIQRLRRYEDLQDAFALTPEEYAAMHGKDVAAGKAAVEDLKATLPGPKSAKESADVFKEQPFSAQVEDTQPSFDQEMSTAEKLQSFLKEAGTPLPTTQEAEIPGDTPIPETGNTVDLEQYALQQPAPAAQSEPTYAPDQITNPELINEIPYAIQQQEETLPPESPQGQEMGDQGQPSVTPPASPAPDTATSSVETVDTPAGPVFTVRDANGTRLVKPDQTTAFSGSLSKDTQTDASGNAVYYHEDTGATIAKNSEGKWVIDGTNKAFDTVAQAGRALSTNPEIQQEVIQSYEATGAEGLATTTNPEKIMAAKEGSVRQILPAAESTPSSGRTKRRVGGGIPAQPQEATQQPAGATPELGQRVVDAILKNDVQGVSEALADLPQSSHKAVVRAAGEIAKERAWQTGDFDVKAIDETLDEVSKVVGGKYTKKSDIQWKAEEGMTGMYTGTDPRTGKTYTLYETYTAPEVNSEGIEVKPGQAQYIVSEGKNVIVSDGKSVTDAKKKMQDFVSRETTAKAQEAGYSLKTLKPGDEGWTSRLTQHRVVDAQGNPVPTKEGAVGFETRKAAQQHLDQLTTGNAVEDSAPKKKKVYADNVREDLNRFLQEERQRMREERANKEGQPSPVRTIELTPEEKKAIEDRINKRITSAFDLGQEDFGPLVSEETDGLTVVQMLTGRGSKYAPLLEQITQEHGEDAVRSVRFKSAIELAGRALPAEIEARIQEGGSWYDPDYNTVFYSPMASERILAHELYHGLTVKAFADLKANKPDGKVMQRFRSLFQSFRVEMIRTGKINDNHLRIIKESKNQRELREAMRGLPHQEQKICYMLHTEEEFISMGMTEQDIQAIMKSVAYAKGERKSVWRRFIESVSSMFQKAEGKSDHTSMLEELLDVTNEMVAHQTPLVFKEDGGVHKSPVREYDLDWDENNLSLNTFGALQDMTPAERIDAIKNSVRANPTVPSEQKRTATKIWEATKDTILSISDELNLIDQRIGFRVAETETKIGRKNAHASDVIRKIRDKMVKMKGDDRAVFNNALANGDTEVRDHYLRKYGVEEIWNKELQPILDEIRTGMIETGMLRDQDTSANWFPRRVQDLEGLIQAINDDKERTLLKNEIEAVMARTGMAEEDAARKVISTFLATGRMNATLRIAKSTKERSIVHVKPEWQGYYTDFLEAVANHVEESHEAIEWRRMIGKNTIPQAKAKLKELEKSLEFAKTQEERDGVLSVMEGYYSVLDDMNNFAKQSIPDMVYSEWKDGGLSKKQLDRVVKLIRARITQAGISNKALRMARDASLMLTLGDVTNTVTQLTDVWQSVYQTNLSSTLKGFLHVVRGKADIKYTDFDFSRSLTEFRASNDSGNFLSLPALFKRIGFTKLDAVMKMTNIQAHILYGQKQVSTEKGEAAFRAKYERAWGKEMTDSVIDSLRKKETTEDTITYAITELAKVNPIFLSSMPVNFNRGGNARIAYTLASYGIKQFGMVYSKGIRKVTHGKGMERVEGLKNLAVCAFLAGLTQAGVGELKDFLKDPLNAGKGFNNTTFLQKFADGMLQLFFLSRHKIEKVGGGSLIDSMVMDMAPPLLKIASVAAKDIAGMATGKVRSAKDVKSLRYVPAMIPGIPVSPGRAAYYLLNAEGAAARSLNEEKKQIFAQAISDHKSGLSTKSVAPLVAEYNKKARQIEGASVITEKTLKSAIDRSRKSNPERKEIFAQFKEYVSKNRPVPEEFRAKVREFNNNAKSNNYDPITPADLEKARKRYK